MQNFEPWLLLFSFSPAIFFCFSCLIFCSLAGLLIGFTLVAKVIGKAFRILESDERKGRWVVEQDFHWNFQVNVTWVFTFFSAVLDWVVLILVWFERSLHSAQVGGQSGPWPLKLMTWKAVESTWSGMGSYRRLGGEWVKRKKKHSKYRLFLILSCDKLRSHLQLKAIDL